MFDLLKKINERPKSFEFYTASDLWTDDHTSEQMLTYHLNKDSDVSSRKASFIQQSVDWMIKQFHISNQTYIADFGCGPGLYANRLGEHHAKVRGIDFSRRSIAYAKSIADQKQLPVHYIHQNYLDFETDEKFDLIIMIMCDFCALSPEQRQTMLKKFYKLLAPGGHVLLDVYTLQAFRDRQETTAYQADLLDGFWSPQPYYGFLNTFKYEDEKVMLDKYTLVEADRTRTVYNWLQYFSRDALIEEFQSCGFNVDQTYANVAGEPFDVTSHEMAIVATK